MNSHIGQSFWLSFSIQSMICTFGGHSVISNQSAVYFVHIHWENEKQNDEKKEENKNEKRTGAPRNRAEKSDEKKENEMI